MDTIGDNIKGTWEQFSFWLPQLVSDNSTIATDWSDEKSTRKVKLVKEKNAGKLLDLIETEEDESSCKNETISDKETQVSDDIRTQVREVIDNYFK